MGNQILTELKKIITENHNKTIYKPVKIGYSSLRVMYIFQMTSILSTKGEVVIVEIKVFCSPVQSQFSKKCTLTEPTFQLICGSSKP